MIVKHGGKLVEIQVRTSLQQAWAELSEKLSDVRDPGLKYGKGDETTVKALLKYSASFTRVEAYEARIASHERRVSVMLSEENLAQDREQQLLDLRREINEIKEEQVLIREESITKIRRFIARVQREAERNALSN